MLKLGFLGTGWIGRNRMEAMLATGEAQAVAICDPNPQMLEEARASAPDARVAPDLDAMLALGLDGVVIATPSALHAEQSVTALNAGAAVFCQKPLARTAAEVQSVLDAAQRNDRLLGVDLSYRHTAAMQAVREQVRSGALGNVFAADLTFHNAYGPGAGWFWDPALSGGGCLIDLGVHLVDLALWMFDFPEVTGISSSLFRDGRTLRINEVEDYAVGTLQLASRVTVRIACSWNLSAGTDAVIAAKFFGSQGGAAMRNVDGSFFDFIAERYSGRETHTLTSPPDQWGARAAADWVRKLAAGALFADSTEGLLDSARALDRLYGRS